MTTAFANAAIQFLKTSLWFVDCVVAPIDEVLAQLHEPDLSFADYRGKPEALRGGGEALCGPDAGVPYLIFAPSSP